MIPMNFIRRYRFLCLILAAVSIQLASPSAWAGGHPKRVLLGYAPVYPYYGTAAAPAAPAPTATGYYYAAAPAPAARGYYYAAAAAPAAAPAPVAAAPAPTGYYTGGGYYYYAGAPAAVAGSPAPAAPSGVRLTDAAARKDVVDRLAALNTGYTAAKLTDDYRKSQLAADSRSLYASKLNTTSDDLTGTEKDDANALAASVYGGAPLTVGATATPAATTPSTAAAAAPAGFMAIPLVPVVARPVHQFWPRPRHFKY